MCNGAKIVEMDEERDRKTCLSLDLKVTGANRDLAQWLVDHPRYPGSVVAGWLGCGERRVQRLRKWAEDGFAGSPYDESNKSRPSGNPSLTTDAALKTNDNSKSEDNEMLLEEEADQSSQGGKSHSLKKRIVDDPDIPAGIVEMAAATGRRRVFLRCAEDAIRKAEQGAGLKDARKREIDDEILAMLDRIVEAWSNLRDEILSRKGE